MSTRQILQSFEAWRAAHEPLVLATVFETAGSTYSKAGHRILLAANGDYRGLVSGGCLEGDLAERARHVVATDEPTAVTYDLRDAADELWGLAIGCNGLIRVFLQPLKPARDYEPFASIAAVLRGGEGAGIGTVIDGAGSPFPTGATVVAGAVPRAFGFASGTPATIVAGARRAVHAGHAALVKEAGATVLYTALRPIPKLLVLGAGLDALPLLGMAVELGWFVTVADHRPAYLERPGFDRADRKVLVEAGRLHDTLSLAEFDAVVVMSHHLPTDRKYLAELAAASHRYIGVLGPRARRARLLDDLGEAGALLRDRLKGPVGLDIHADSPESIALSILAELQATLHERER
jgi:xanthine/CO dehydrogenase XdhC/CoxF family maturation factor